MKTMHLFAGVGGGLLADLILGHEPIVAVEWDAYACQVLRERAADGWFPNLRVWEGDVRLFDPSEYAGRVDCIHAGFPCQDISVAGNQAGVGTETRSGLYREVIRIACIIRPRYLFLENVAAILGNGLGTVLADLAAMGFDARWLCIRASDVGAPHHRDRWFLLATYANSGNGSAEQKRKHERAEESCGSGAGEVESLMADSRHSRICERWKHSDVICDVRITGGNERHGVSGSEEEKGDVLVDTNSPQRQGNECSKRIGEEYSDLGCVSWWDVEPGLGRVANGVPNRVGQLKGYGNAQVPLQAAVAWKLLGGE